MVGNARNAKVASATVSSVDIHLPANVSITSSSCESETPCLSFLMEHKGSQTYSCLRCQNFETLEDQLHSIQNDLSDLTSLVRGGNSVRSSSLAAEEWAPDNLAGTDSGPVAHTNCHIVRDASQSLDRYHGPCSLYALCKEFHDDPIFGVPDNNTSTHTAEHAMLQEMLYKASNEPHLDIPSQPTGICLPPRQFLNLVIGPFFKNTDYATDVFVRSAFQLQIDRIYSQPIVPSDEGWAICFNVIVLLGIKREPTTQGNSHFIQSLLQTMRMAINNPRVFLTPRLVNVQALALLVRLFQPESLDNINFNSRVTWLSNTVRHHLQNWSSPKLVCWHVQWVSIGVAHPPTTFHQRLYWRDTKSFSHCIPEIRISLYFVALLLGCQDMNPGFHPRWKVIQNLLEQWPA